MPLLVLAIFRKYCIFYADIAILLQYFNNISDRFWNILAILQYCLNMSVLCGKGLSCSDTLPLQTIPNFYKPSYIVYTCEYQILYSYLLWFSNKKTRITIIF